MGFFSRGESAKSWEGLAAVISVGSSFVSGALFRMEKSGTPKIIFSVREPIKLTEQLDVENFLTLTLETLNSVAEKIALSKRGAPGKIYCVLSSPWYVSQNRVVKLERNTPFIFNDKLSDSLIGQEIKIFEDDYLRSHEEAGHSLRAIEVRNLKTVLNGYEVVSAVNQRAKELEMTLFISIAEEIVLTEIEKIITRHFHRGHVEFCSFLLSAFTVVRDIYMHPEDFLLVDIGGEVTDISMIKKNMLRESISFPAGSNFVIRGLASSLKIGFEEAGSIFSAHKDGHIEEKLAGQIEPTVNQLKTDWLRKFQSTLATLSKDISIPSSIFLTVDKGFADFFAEAIKTEQFNQYTFTESKFQVVFLNAAALHKVATFDDDAVRDDFLIISSVYINRFLNQKPDA